MDPIKERLNLQPIEIRRNNMLNQNMKPDVAFIVGKDKERIFAFKQILGLSNDIFLKMFNGDYREETEIVVPEFEPDDFKDFLLYLYFQEIDLKNLNPYNLYTIAQKYMVLPLSKKCINKIGADLSYYNVFSTMEWNLIYEDPDLWSFIKKFITKNIIGCLTVKEGFRDLSEESVQKILKWNNIWCFETFLFSHVLKWANDQLDYQRKQKTLANKKEVLAGILSLIRMKVNEDLTYDKNCINSRYIWKVASGDEKFFALITKSTVSTWINSRKFLEKTVCFGFKMPLTNIYSKPGFIEEFTLSYICENSVFEIQTFKIPIRSNVAIRDIYFEKPVVFEANETYEIRIQFKSQNERFTTFMTNFSNINVVSVSLYLFLVQFNTELHKIYEIEKNIDPNVSLPL